ncbi:MAG: hypothetical protein NTX66_00895 [Candidatus Falkowbacteria bacterium]|nr:hypothetical protein [Candidatus Falkowbacteria bacterium]
MKHKTKPFKKIIALIFIILVGSLVLSAIIINYSYWLSARNSKNEASGEFVKVTANDLPENAKNLPQPETGPGPKGEITNTVKPTTATTAPTDVNDYSAVITVIRESTGLKILNYDVSSRGNSATLSPKEEWLIVSLNKKNNSFRTYCRAGFLITDCSGGNITRSKTEEYCSRMVEKDAKNTISLECGKK